MPIIFGGTTVEKVVFGGTEVDKVVFNGVTVFEKMPQLATPQNVTADGTVVSWDEVENATSYEVIEGGNNVLGTYTPVTLISFTIGDMSYQAEEGMTWAQWVASSYNNNGWDVNSEGHIYRYHATVTTDTNQTTYCNSTDEIIAGNAYGVATTPGGSTQ